MTETTQTNMKPSLFLIHVHNMVSNKEKTSNINLGHKLPLHKKRNTWNRGLGKKVKQLHVVHIKKKPPIYGNKESIQFLALLNSV